jgi:sulfoxide reductase heme-binding subunit YedZ
MTRRRLIWLKTLAWAACLAPAGLLAYRTATGALGPNPIEEVTRTLGVWTLRLLLASLAMTPLRLLFGLAWPLALRRLLGLFAFFYLGLHFSVWIVLDHFFDWPQMGADIVKRPYITAGVLALLLLTPLAATSTAGMVRRLGAAAWQRLHRLVYVAAGLGVLHFLWLAKAGRDEPYWYGVALAVLLGVRAWAWARRLARRRGEALAGRAGAVARRGLVVVAVLAAGLLGSPG